MLRASAVLLALPLLIAAASATIRSGEGVKPVVMEAVSPGEAVPGAVVAVTGANLDMVRALYLTDGNNDFAMEIVEQTGAILRFRIPAKTPAGRMRIAIEETITGRFLEEPVFVNVLRPVG